MNAFIFVYYDGGLAGVRTRDLRLKRALLYRLSYKSIFHVREHCIKLYYFVQSFFDFYLFFRLHKGHIQYNDNR